MDAFAPTDAARAPLGAEPDSEPELATLLDDWLNSVGDADAGAAGADASAPVSEAPISAAPDRPASLLDALAIGGTDAGLAAGAPLAPAESAARLRVNRFVLFTAGPTTYGVPDAFVIEVGRVPKITPVPRVPAWLRGVTNLRGDVMSVIDLRTLLGIDATSLHSARLLIVRLTGEAFSLGLLVDAVDQIAAVPPDDLRAPASPLEGPLATYLTGVCRVGDRLVAVLDLDRLLRSPEIRQFDDLHDTEPSR